MRLFRLQLSNLPVFFRKRVGMSGINALVVGEHSIMAIRQTVVADDQLVIVLLKGEIRILQLRSSQCVLILAPASEDVYKDFSRVHI
jgi:hypothetical protein